MAPRRRPNVPQLLTLTIAAAVLPAAEAVIVSPGSPCETSCGNVLDATAPDELVCHQDSYAEDGQLFQGCVECQMLSGYYNDETSDTQWMLYNLRYAISSCLFGNPEPEEEIGDTPCATREACGNFEDAISSGNLTTDGEAYDYCRTWPTEDAIHVEQCHDCLRFGGNEYLANFFTVLQAGCEQRPAKGIDVGFEGTMFSTQQVNITEPQADIDPSWFDQGPIGLGAKVGIVVGGVVVLLVIAGCFIVCRGRRKRKAFLRTLEYKPNGRKAWPSSPPQGEMFETPVSQRPLRSWDDSPMSAHGDQQFPQYFSPYSSQYNSPVSAQDATPQQQQQQWQDSSFGGAQNIGVALGGDEKARNQSQHQWSQMSLDGKGKAKDDGSYEMHQVESAGGGGGGSFRERQRLAHLQQQQQQQQHDAPMLSHPGYGRTSDSPPRTYGVMDHDNNGPPNTF